MPEERAPSSYHIVFVAVAKAHNEELVVEAGSLGIAAILKAGHMARECQSVY
jgi:hypothetical protein